jgi:hypothetical protein
MDRLTRSIHKSELLAVLRTPGSIGPEQWLWVMAVCDEYVIRVCGSSREKRMKRRISNFYGTHQHLYGF